MKSTFTVLGSLLAASLLPQLASAHGIPFDVSVNGQSFGNDAIRKVSSGDPIYGVDNPDINCGRDAKPAPNSLKVKPGDTLSWQWNNGGNGKWPHNIGSIITYMASCGNKPCSEFDSKNAKFFKTSQQGRENPDRWFQADMMEGKPSTAKVPDNLAPGNYLIQHGPIGLHIADSMGAEFYPSCTQVEVGGNGNGVPDPKDLVTFPGGYKEGEDGITGKGVFDGAEYKFPGPPIAKLSANGNPDQPKGTVPDTPPAAPSPTKGSKNGKACILKKREVVVKRPRAPSRVMYHLRSHV
jgi:plastocyanin